MANGNMQFWDKLKDVPKDARKPFRRSGGFSGTAIKPMWTYFRMTEIFGPCGTGWGINAPTFTVQPAGNDILVYCVVTVWYGPEKNQLTGVGGDKVLAQQKSGPFSDDEAFKKAFTDAVTNALKTLGAGADVHMGVYEGSKYEREVDEPPAADNDPFAPAEPAKTPAPRSPQFRVFAQDIRDCKTVEACVGLGNAMKVDTAKMSADETEALRVLWKARMEELEKPKEAA